VVHPSQQDFCRLWGQLIARAWTDAEFKKRLLADPAEILQEHGYELPPGMDVRLSVAESDDHVLYLYVPCPEELSNDNSAEAGEVAGECLNNRIVLARLAAESADKR
jgi:hypothetical protein